MTDDYTTIKENEYHPAVDSAMAWLKEFQREKPHEWAKIKESIASTALSENRLAEICHGTIQRLEDGEPVSDRYLLGLCWFVRENFSDIDNPQ